MSEDRTVPKRARTAPVEPALRRAPAARDWTRELARRIEAGEAVVIATVVAVDGSASAQPGAKALLDARGQRLLGWVGGGCAETTVGEAAREALAERRPRQIRLDLDDEVLGVGMPCGGFMTVYLEPVLPRTRLVVLGHGVIAETLCAMGAALDLSVEIHDALASPATFPQAELCVADDPEYAKVTCDADTYVVITTQHRSDYEALSAVLRQSPAYVGLVASRKRGALLMERLLEDGFARATLAALRAPVGLDIGAETPQEIALSILAEIAQCRRGGTATGRSLAELRGPRITEAGIELPDAGERRGAGDRARCPR
jgi:xanthine dehydrogenase accessory factor